MNAEFPSYQILSAKSGKQQRRNEEMKVKCPNCEAEVEVSKEAVLKDIGAKGGAKSKRDISPEAQAKMQKSKALKREKRQAAK